MLHSFLFMFSIQAQWLSPEPSILNFFSFPVTLLIVLLPGKGPSRTLKLLTGSLKVKLPFDP